METVTQKQKLLDLIKQQSTYKFIVSLDLEKKIRYYLDKFPNIEYSGTLFYKVSGSFEENNLVVEGIDFLLQDIGTGGYTEFNQSPDVISYMVAHPELLNDDVYQGLMHSHHTLGAFFSGTDTSTLREEGSERTHFVSLIIDTKGTYQAAITRIVIEDMQATGFLKYKTFQDKEITGKKITYNYTRKRLDYFMLNVERPVVDNPFQELSSRIHEVYKQKEELKKQKPLNTSFNSCGTYFNSCGTYFPNYNQPNNFSKNERQEIPANKVTYQANVGKGNIINNQSTQQKLPFEIAEDPEDQLPPYDTVSVDSDIIKDLACQLLTGDINYYKHTEENYDDLAKLAEELFEGRFSDISLFHAWAEQYVEFLVYYTEDPKLTMFEDEVLAALVAYDLLKILDSIKDKGKFVNVFMEILNRYII